MFNMIYAVFRRIRRDHLMRYSLAAAFTLSALLACAQADSASGASSVMHFRGTSVESYFINSDGCLTNEVFVGAGDEVFPGLPWEPPDSTYVDMLLLQYDVCTSTELIFASDAVRIAAEDFVVDPRLETATLNTSITLPNATTSEDINVDIDMTWTANGRRLTDIIHHQFVSAGCRVEYRNRNGYRPALVSGTVTDGVTANFIAGPADAGNIGFLQTGIVIIDCI